MLYSFGVKSNNKRIIEFLNYEFENCNLDGLYISMHKFKNYENIILHYKNEGKNDFCALIAGILTKVVNKFYEENIIKRLILSNYFYFSEYERKEILNCCYEYIADSPKDMAYKNNLIFMEIFDYAKKNKSMILDGFINFRLKKYLKYLDELVDISVDRFVIEKEYNEFIDILKLYINSKETKSKLIHLVYYKQESILLDINKKIIDTSSEVFDSKYLSDISFSTNDYALNALLGLLPEKLCIHLIEGEEDDFINTLKKIFGNRAKICIDCGICSIYRNQNNKATLKN